MLFALPTVELWRGKKQKLAREEEEGFEEVATLDCLRGWVAAEHLGVATPSPFSPSCSGEDSLCSMLPHK